MTLDVTAQIPKDKRLAANSVGLAHIVFFVVAAAAPLTAVVGATPPAFALGNGAGVPGTFVLTGLMYIIFAAGFTAMGRHVGGAGAFYTYIAQGIGRPFGVGGAFMAMLTYTSIQVAILALFGVFLSGALQGAGINIPWWVYALAALTISFFAGRRNISFSGKLLGVCMLAEIVILFLLDVGIVIKGGGPQGLTVTAFSISSVFSHGVGITLVFVVGSFVGFEATAIFGEEARNPDRTIPMATYVAVLLITAFYAFSTWAIEQYYGPSQIQHVANGALQTLYFDAAKQILGSWSVTVMNTLLIISLFACILSLHNTLNRYVFALAREGVAWDIMARVHKDHGSPHVAGFAQVLIAAGIIVAFVLGRVDPYAVVFPWMSSLGVIGILAVQCMVCVAVVMYFRREHEHEHSKLVTLILPIIAFFGLAGFIWLVSSNLTLLAGSNSIIVRSFPWDVLVVGLAGVGLAFWLKSSRPEKYEGLGRVFE